MRQRYLKRMARPEPHPPGAKLQMVLVDALLVVVSSRNSAGDGVLLNYVRELRVLMRCIPMQSAGRAKKLKIRLRPAQEWLGWFESTEVCQFA